MRAFTGLIWLAAIIALLYLCMACAWERPPCAKPGLYNDRSKMGGAEVCR